MYELEPATGPQVRAVCIGLADDIGALDGGVVGGVFPPAGPPRDRIGTAQRKPRESRLREIRGCPVIFGATAPLRFALPRGYRHWRDLSLRTLPKLPHRG